MTDGSGDAPSEDPAAPAPTEDDEQPLRETVEEAYDFEEFGPRQMAEMSVEEWEAVFDPETWVTGPELLDRLENELAHRIATRDIFGMVERERHDGEEVVLAYSDTGYAMVDAAGTIEGEGTIRRDVEPSVALCSMPEYDVPEPPASATLPDPDSVESGTGSLGNRLVQAVALAQVLAGVVLFAAWLLAGLSVIVPIVAVGFLSIGVLLFVVVANARLSDRFRAEAYRERLRALGVGSGTRPAFVPGSEQSLEEASPKPAATDDATATQTEDPGES